MSSSWTDKAANNLDEAKHLAAAKIDEVKDKAQYAMDQASDKANENYYAAKQNVRAANQDIKDKARDIAKWESPWNMSVTCDSNEPLFSV